MKHNYINKHIEIIRDVKIREYDIKSAGLNILYNRGYVDKEEYEMLLSMPKLERNVIIGKWLRDNPEINAVMMNEFVRIRKIFFEMNEISDDEILSIKKDAIFIVDRELTNLKFENYEFTCREEFTDYIFMDKKEYYYNKYTDELEVKGFPKEVKEFQQEYFFKLIKKLLKLGKDKKEIFRTLIEFKTDFLERTLPKQYYRSVATNLYPFKLATLTRYMEEIPDELICEVDISANLQYLNNIISLFV